MYTKVGDILEIPLSENRKAYAQYILKDKKYANLIKVFDYINDGNGKIDLDQIVNTPQLFSPVYTSVLGAIKFHKWKKVGSRPVKKFSFPGFISTFYTLTGKAGVWYLWDGESSINLGYVLPDEYKKLEYLAIYSPDLIEKRIMNGERPYQDLIMTNKLNN